MVAGTMSDADKVFAFIEENRVLTLCTARDSVPWGANCFYAFDPDAVALLFMTDPATRHGGELTDNGNVAGTISAQEPDVGRLQGIQFSGTAEQLTGEMLARGLELFLGRFPFARARQAPLWAATLDLLKFTDNTLGFGTKLYWRRDPSE